MAHPSGSASGAVRVADELRRPLEQARVDFILLALSDVLWRGPQPDLDRVFRLFADAGALIETVMPPLVKAVFGLPLPADKTKHRSPIGELADAILAVLDHRVRIVYGCADCLYGTFGTLNRFSFGTQIPGFDRAIRTLLTLKRGTHR
jgi:hypothetical protein